MLDNGARLANDPAIPEAMNDREGDIAVPLLAIADHAGPTWAERARRALLDVFGMRAQAEGNKEAGVELLADIRMVLKEHSADKMGSAALCQHLAKMEGRPWPEWRQGKPITQTQLAKALRPFGLLPTTIRSGQRTEKGYQREAFKDVWLRYLPGDDPPAEATAEPYDDRTKDGAWKIVL